MQQVGTGSRFWWRALDAQTPQPDLPHNSPRGHALPNTKAPQRQIAMPRPMGMTLQIPRGDRRVHVRRKTNPLTAGVVLSVFLLAVASAAAMLAVSLPANALRDAQDKVRLATTQAVIAAGFGIDQVSLTGQRYTQDSDVYDALDLRNVTTFAQLDTAAVLKRIERISWVDTAQITRVFPGMLNVQINERQPAAIWSRGGARFLIDATGRTLGPIQATNGWALPLLAGEGANIDAPLLLTALSRHKDLQNRFSYAERIAERRWSVVLNNGSRIELGADREVEGLDQVASSSVLRKALSAAPSIVDVRTSGRAVVRPVASQTTFNAAPKAMPGVQRP